MQLLFYKVFCFTKHSLTTVTKSCWQTWDNLISHRRGETNGLDLLKDVTYNMVTILDNIVL